jgi:hypothetical protein
MSVSLSPAVMGGVDHMTVHLDWTGPYDSPSRLDRTV